MLQPLSRDHKKRKSSSIELKVVCENLSPNYQQSKNHTEDK